MTIWAFQDVHDDERIEQVTIADDASLPEYFNELKNLCSDYPKVKLIGDDENLDCYKNKCRAMIYSDTLWNILLDSDNKIDESYLDRLFEISEWDENTIYTPSFAKPNFNFTPYEGLTISKENVAEYIDKPLFQTMLNASNFFINKETYLRVWDGSIDPVTSDSIYFCYKWLESGRKIFVVPNLHYDHKVHVGHYQQNIHRTPVGFHESIMQKLRELK